MEFKDLTPEQKSKVRAASSAEELLELAKAEGVELSANELDKISGGEDWRDMVGCSTCAMEYDHMSYNPNSARRPCTRLSPCSGSGSPQPTGLSSSREVRFPYVHERKRPPDGGRIFGGAWGGIEPLTSWLPANSEHLETHMSSATLFKPYISFKALKRYEASARRNLDILSKSMVSKRIKT